MFFKRSRNIIRKQPIEIALDMLMHSMNTIYEYKNNKQYMPSENELQMLDLFAEELWQSHRAAVLISCCLHQRNRGEKEDPTRITDAERIIASVRGKVV